MKKRLLSLVLAFCLALSLAPAAFAAGIADSGANSDGSVTWTLDTDGNLTVTGSGFLEASTFRNRKDIVTVKFVCEDGSLYKNINILKYAFAGCTNLRSVDFGDQDVGSLHSHAFDGCTSLTEIRFGSSFGYINAYAFRGCTSLRQLTLPGNFYDIGKYAFADCTALTEVTLEPDPDGTDGFITLESHAFAGCTSLRSLNMSERIERIDSYVFSGCSSLEWLPIETVPTLDEHAFAGWTGLKSAVLSPQLKSLPDGLFDGCTGLQRVTVQNNVTSIGTGVFTGCTALTDVYYTGTQTQWAQIRTPKGEDVLGSAALHCNAAAHTFTGWVETKAATCTEDGVQTRTCTDPGCRKAETRAIPALGHDWDDGEVRVAPSGVLAGVRVYTCSRCGQNAISFLDPEIPAYDYFTDIDPESWSYPGIQYCVALGLMSGTGGTAFSPNGVTTRAQLVQILYNMEGEPDVTGTTPFTDLTADWYQDAVLWAYQTGVVSGTGDGTTFSPDAPVTREQIAVVLVDFLVNVYGLECRFGEGRLVMYADSDEISEWARPQMAAAVNHGLISGSTDGVIASRYLRPRASATRAEIATILESMCSEVLGIG